MKHIKIHTVIVLLLITFQIKAQYTPCIVSNKIDTILKLEKYVRSNYITDTSKTKRYYEIWYKVNEKDTIFGIDINPYQKETIDFLVQSRQIEMIQDSRKYNPKKIMKGKRGKTNF